MAEEKEPIQSPFFASLIKSFKSLYDPSSPTDPDRVEISMYQLRDFFSAYFDFSTGLDPLTRYIEELECDGFNLSHNYEHEPCMFVKEALADYEEIT